jgi:hypothetical protein
MSLSLLNKSKITLEKRPLVRALLFVAIATFFFDYVLGKLPITKLPMPQFWQVLIWRLASASASLVAIRFLFPQSMRKLSFRFNLKSSLIGLGVTLYFTLAPLINSEISNFSAAQIFEGFAFALCIGIDEEIFSRVLIFGALEKCGTLLAVIISSIHFGLLHIANYFWGGQSLSHTIAQMVNASAFGFLMCALMITTGNIWIPVLLHGLNDTPMQFEKAIVTTTGISNGPDWIGTTIYVISYILVGCLILRFRRKNRKMDQISLLNERKNN